MGILLGFNEPIWVVWVCLMRSSTAACVQAHADWPVAHHAVALKVQVNHN